MIESHQSCVDGTHLEIWGYEQGALGADYIWCVAVSDDAANLLLEGPVFDLRQLELRWLDDRRCCFDIEFADRPS